MNTAGAAHLGSLNRHRIHGHAALVSLDVASGGRLDNQLVAQASEGLARRMAEGCIAQQFNVAWPLMAAQPNGILPPSAEVRRVAFSGRGQDQIELSAWRASASDATDSWPEWAGCTEKHRPCSTRRRTSREL